MNVLRLFCPSNCKPTKNIFKKKEKQKRKKHTEKKNTSIEYFSEVLTNKVEVIK